MTNNIINEATLEARIHKIIDRIFPSIEKKTITHQDYFYIQFGHRSIKIENQIIDKDNSKAISDILIFINNRPSVLLELKKPSIIITKDDISQAISYARLTEIVTPITVVSNGEDTRIYQTYTKDELRNTTIDEELLDSILKQGMKIAANDFQEAISCLIGKDTRLLISVINEISNNKFNDLIGNLADLSKPIVTQFNIQRTVVGKIFNIIDSDKNFIALSANPQSGKTNILYQLYMNSTNNNFTTLYIDLNSSYGIFKQLSNHLTRFIKFKITQEDVKEWFLLTISGIQKIKLLLLIDNWNFYIRDELVSEIYELIEIFDNTKNCIVLSIDSSIYKLISKHPNRLEDNIIGKKFSIIEFDNFDNNEFDEINKILVKNYNTVFSNGAQYTIEYRIPRFIRFIANYFEINNTKQEDGKTNIIIPIPKFTFINIVSSDKIFSVEIIDLYRKLSLAFINDDEFRSSKSEYAFVSYASNAISIESVEEYLESNEIDILIKNGYLEKQLYSDNKIIVYPKIPELLTFDSIDIITSYILTTFKKDKQDDSYKYFIDTCYIFIYNDLLAVAVLHKLYINKEYDVFSYFVKKLFEDKPKIEKVKAGSQFAIYIPNKGVADITLNDLDENDSCMMSNHYPWIILSHLLSTPFEINGSLNAYFEILLEIASFPFVLKRVGYEKEMLSNEILSHDIPGYGSLLCHEMGIIEPITQSIIECLIRMPDEINHVIDNCIKLNDLQLIWRMYLACRVLINNEDPRVRKSAKYAEKILIQSFKEEFQILLHGYQLITNKGKKRKARKKRRKAKDNKRKTRQ